MRVWYATGFPGHWPTGTAAVVVADDGRQAHEMLADKLAEEGLPRPEYGSYTMAELDTNVEGARLLVDGDY